MKTRMKPFVAWTVATLIAIALSEYGFAVSPPPDGGYANDNTAEGTDALFSLTSGADNAAVGFDALFSNTDGNFNTATGFQALLNNTEGNSNTATGFQALLNNTTGGANTANGPGALLKNTTGSNNVATGVNTLGSNTTGCCNIATGNGALFSNTTGIENTAIGTSALVSNTTGNNNTATGSFAAQNLTTGSNNIDIGNFNPNNFTSTDVGGESNTIRIGVPGVQTATFIAGINGVDKNSGKPVFIDANGQLGTGTAGGVPKGTIITVAPNSPTPADYTLLGTLDEIHYKDVQGHDVHIKGAKLYQKN